MKKILFLVLLAAVSAFAVPALGLEPQGKIYGTDIEYSNFAVTKRGVDVRLSNTYQYDVKVSLRIDFYDRSGNTLGYSLFGLREIPAESYVDISGNYLNGTWKKCRDADRIAWQRMTYEVLY